ncbi:MULTISPECIES: bacillithiol system redox-active protein YtxJ [unclassified Siphonobacter]|uniref:bacillithiol system redox-active protein YtxJ n=1 Tax=unclassified Siphonobacter TaxID=2635712 RepID=UPI000CC5847F|nr:MULTISPECIES: bacillithiol system redox-active protein YtxJ [unclassified Siphonobacter]MDQ1088408.1 bacillithiol system protein YtxJ [Siphonobacter sp. SORGH_AS_1065]MDR6194550.1 bacillithiol system protein YtxJ [Siphonobacter sp. SORGH_AS_0500]PKK37827.1 thioredoxin family protein [Siphonobacter sp. SORGH_AS_0500]
MNWQAITELEQLETIAQASFDHPVLIYKHSTTCSISATAKSRLERQWDDSQGIESYYLDLLRYRPISQAIAEKFEVQHESPQVLLIRDGKCVYNESHFAIQFGEILANA